MRLIKFRGKKISNGEWVYGSFHQYNDHPGLVAILENVEAGTIYSVNPETVGQYTGLNDKKGNLIYEGDIIELINASGDIIRVICEYGIARRYLMLGSENIEVDIPGFYFKLSNGKKTFPIVNNYLGKHDLEIFEVVSNIHDNKDPIPQT